MMTGGVREYPGAVFDTTAFRIVCAEIKTPQSRKGNGGGAHRARLQSHVQIGALESFLPQTPGDVADRQHLGGRRGIAPRLDLVVRPSQDLAPVTIHEHGADRHLA